MPGDLEFDCVTILGMDTGKAIVEITFGDTVIQVEASKAKEMASILLDVAHASEMDRAVFRYLTEEAKVGFNAAAAMIHDLRRFRK